MTPPLPDLLRKQDGGHPFWLRVIFMVAAAVCFVLGVVGWLIPVITGIPFYAAGLVFLGLASDRTRRFINRMERRLSESTRRKIRRMIAKVPGRWVRGLVHIPDEVA
ncbi:MAG TPA: hypothetical protein VLK35_18795 [Methylomirabilota bacterium]|nr:hypothetical protein [Methylomirabilota bacterium]